MTPTPTTAILLAAGRARRLGSLTDDRPKCLLDVGGRTLIQHQLQALRAVGVTRVVVVTGYFADMVEAECGPGVTYVHNEIFDRTNSLYSLEMALHHGADGFFLTNADVLFDPALLRRLASTPHPDALLYEPARDLGEEEMKVRLQGDRVCAMSKELDKGTYHGENLGVLRFSRDGYRRLEPFVRRLVVGNEATAWAPLAFDAFSREHPLHAVSSEGSPWIEIDFPEDLERARTVVWPRIASGRAVADAREARA